MKKYLGLLLGGCLLAGCSMADFNGSRTGNDSQFLMEYTIFNTTDSQLLELKKGDKIHGEIERKRKTCCYHSAGRERAYFRELGYALRFLGY